ncbi:trypsin-like serine protease, partial [Streptomyces sp. AC627_RSS907]|uniref:trypsin-like serine protease n=1 Tax=Streptomyces sp. AC627_RSS907 TaxID=2823684 RepID=UPI001C255FCE
MRISRLIPALVAASASVMTLAGTATAAEPAPKPSTPSSVETKIIGGGYAQSGPWAARLFSNGRQTCTATIISANWILTAKHC